MVSDISIKSQVMRDCFFLVTPLFIVSLSSLQSKVNEQSPFAQYSK